MPIEHAIRGVAHRALGHTLDAVTEFKKAAVLSLEARSPRRERALSESGELSG